MCQLEHPVKGGRRRFALPAALLALAVVAGCGSTARLAASAGGTTGALGAPRAPTGAVGVGQAGASSGPAAVAGGSAAAAGPSGAGSVGPGPSGPGAAVSGPPGSGLPAGVEGPGVSSNTVAIGVAYFQNANQANQAIGGKGISVSDPVAVDRLVVGDVNAHGGIAGRRVQLFYFPVDPQSSQPYASEAQAMCSYFTQDHKVLLVVDGTQAVGYLARPCLQAHSVAYLTDNTAVISDLGAYEFDPDALRWERVLAALVPALARQSWFSPWDRTRGAPGLSRARVGIVLADRPALDAAVSDILIPRLRQAGYAPSPADVIRITEPGGFSDDAATVAAIDNAALKLNADGVDHVILTDSNGSLSLLFNNYAYSQRYLPRYGGDTGNFWQSLLTAGDIQAATLRGAEGIGWAPILDLPYSSSGDGPYANATRARCFAVMRAGGQPPTSATVAASELVACDAFYFLQEALRGHGFALNLSTLTERVNGLGPAFRPALALADDFSRDTHDGPAASVDMSFQSSCSCFGYSGPTRTLPAAP